GLPGEIVIGGVQLADGYLERPYLTQERFAPLPALDPSGALFYRTGDQGRWRSDGAIAYLGRADGQIKLRGQRIELGEIETVLERHQEVRKCAVRLEGEGASARIAAFIVLDDPGAPPPLGALRVHAAQFLGLAMQPALYAFIDALPVTANGKLDRARLKLPQEDDREAKAARAPAPGAESIIAQAWADVLEHEDFGVDDGFFDVGGTSLSLVAVESRLRNRWPELEFAALFRHPTISGLAAALDGPVDPLIAAPQAATRAAPQDKEIAITAAVGRFPGAQDVRALWQMLLDGERGYRPPRPEDGPRGTQAASPGVIHVPLHFRPAGLDLFDPEAFGLRPSDALMLDPQIRLLMELAWQALDEAGLDPDALSAGVGIFTGTGLPAYGLARLLGRGGEGLEDPSAAYAQIIASDKDFVPGRIAHALGLKGPAIAVQTACSTGLVAVHMAAEAIRRGDCDAALAGAATLQLPALSYPWQEGGILSRSGQCLAFAEDADGTVPGEGGALLCLRRLEDALAAGDEVLGVLKGSAINNDGKNRSAFTAPTIEGQASVIAAAQARAGLSPREIGYVEAHGTGTKLGDVVETTALAAVFADPSSSEENAPKRMLGALKSNIGHLDTAAGLAGLIKALLSVKRGIIPGTPGSERVNPALPLAQGSFTLTPEVMPWPGGFERRVAGVSSFGIGGTNAHAIVAEAPESAQRAQSPAGKGAGTGESGAQLLPLGAPDQAGLARWAGTLAAALPGLPLAATAWTLQSGRRRHGQRA
ncbi:MAG: beta-ketoacyl synthase N-terminal-like domain-containing protein, partial [Pseudomonadota bacterium]